MQINDPGRSPPRHLIMIERRLRRCIDRSLRIKALNNTVLDLHDPVPRIFAKTSKSNRYS